MEDCIPDKVFQWGSDTLEHAAIDFYLTAEYLEDRVFAGFTRSLPRHAVEPFADVLKGHGAKPHEVILQTSVKAGLPLSAA